jgi:hypothetical protein
MGCGTFSLTLTDKVVTALITAIYITMPLKGGIPAFVLFALLELAVHQINRWQERCEEDAFIRGLGFAY